MRKAPVFNARTLPSHAVVRRHLQRVHARARAIASLAPPVSAVIMKF
ncbi:hypothetical protein XOCgx_3321 [Xanthomonas oryzae pv. oryzicola]|nr:hypothetical protein XOCgx_3321 [Xanthomonas oryzae pv. oryzicola]